MWEGPLPGGGSGALRLGLGMASSEYALFRANVAAADDVGFAWVTVGDNPASMRDTYVSLAVLATATSRCWIGTAVTNPLDRDPLVVASALSSVESLAPGRVFLGIATGRARARGAAPLAVLREHIEILRSLWAGESPTYQGETIHLRWPARPVPILICASGPKGLRLAGEIADGVIIETGVSPEAVALARGWIAEGAATAGRDPAELDTWWYVKASIAATDEEAESHALGPIAGSAGSIAHRDPVALGIPPQFHDEVRRVAAGFDRASHTRTDAGDPNRMLLQPGPFKDYAFDRYGLVGSPATWKARLEEFHTRGIDQIFCAASVPDVRMFIDQVGEDIIPAFADR